MQQERRNAHRTRLPGAYVVYESASHEPREAELHDIGAKGLFVPTPTPLPCGTRIAMEIRLARGGPSWTALGRVVWTRASAAAGRPSGMGVKIVDLDEAAVEAIQRAIGPAPPARERTVRGVGTPTPPAVWVAKPAADQPAPASEREGAGQGRGRAARGQGRARGRVTAVAWLVAAAAMAVAVAALGVTRGGGLSAMKGRAAAAELAVATAPAAVTAVLPTPSPVPSETSSAQPAPVAGSGDAPAPVVPAAASAAPKPAKRPAPAWWSARPKRPSAPPSDNPY